MRLVCCTWLKRVSLPREGKLRKQLDYTLWIGNTQDTWSFDALVLAFTSFRTVRNKHKHYWNHLRSSVFIVATKTVYWVHRKGFLSLVTLGSENIPQPISVKQLLPVLSETWKHIIKKYNVARYTCNRSSHHFTSMAFQVNFSSHFLVFYPQIFWIMF